MPSLVTSTTKPSPGRMARWSLGAGKGEVEAPAAGTCAKREGFHDTYRCLPGTRAIGCRRGAVCHCGVVQQGQRVSLYLMIPYMLAQHGTAHITAQPAGWWWWCQVHLKLVHECLDAIKRLAHLDMPCVPHSLIICTPSLCLSLRPSRCSPCCVQQWAAPPSASS